MDITLPSSSGDFVPLDVHEVFLRVSHDVDVVAKIVVTPATFDGEVLAAAEMVEGVGADILLVLQPVAPFARVKAAPQAQTMLDLQSACMRVHQNTRVIPQTHKLIGVR